MLTREDRVSRKEKSPRQPAQRVSAWAVYYNGWDCDGKKTFAIPLSSPVAQGLQFVSSARSSQT